MPGLSCSRNPTPQDRLLSFFSPVFSRAIYSKNLSIYFFRVMHVYRQGANLCSGGSIGVAYLFRRIDYPETLMGQGF